MGECVVCPNLFTPQLSKGVLASNVPLHLLCVCTCRAPSGSMEGQGQEMESSVPFLSPFPSINSSQSSSSGALFPIAQLESHKAEHSHLSQITPDKGGDGGEGEWKGGGDDMLFEVDIDGRDLEPGPMNSTEHDASATYTIPSVPPVGENGCKSSKGRDSVDPAIASPVSSIAATTCTSVQADEIETVPGMAGSIQHDRVDAVTPIESSGMTAKVSTRFSSSLNFLLGESSSSTVKKGKSRAVDLRDLKGSSSFTDGPRRSRDAAVPHGDHLEGPSAATPLAPLHAASTSASKEVGDKLLRIAEDLLSVKHVSTNSMGTETETEMETATLVERLKAESRLRTDTAKKLLLLSKILSGRASMEEYSAFN